MTKQYYQCMQCVIAVSFVLVLIGCKPIQPVAVVGSNVPPAQPSPTLIATPTSTEPLDEERQMRTVVEVAVQAIFTPTQVYSGTFVSILMGMPILWVDYSVTRFDEVHGYVHSSNSADPMAIAYECEQTAAGSRFFPQPLPTDATQFSPCNMPFQLMAGVLPAAPEVSKATRLFGGGAASTFAHFMSLGQKEIPTQFEFLDPKADTRRANGYQFTTATSTVELWLDAETGAPLLLNNTPLDKSGGFIPFQSFAFAVQR
ncbi:MAG: hypothetical protein R3C14_54945 [Caldilineaceae bacterium]